MKIACYHWDNKIKLGIVKEKSILPVDFHGDMIDLINSWPFQGSVGEPIPLDKIRWAPPISSPSKIIGIGLNYLDHIRESKGKVLDFPVLFAKFPNSIVGHGDKIEWDRSLTKKVDFEAELAVIIGKKSRNLNKDDVSEYIFGYTCANDVSARDLQFGDKQWVRGKTLDTFCPIGPWVVTADEIPDPNKLNIKSRLNNKIMQDSNTGMMLFNVPELLVFLTRNFTLMPGDIILTGTPHGVGTFREPSIYMKDGDQIEIEIERIGRLLNTCTVK
jgi:2-keto-4-pentenoate hydratase/2-oxohepta-3-ene-1,7-dioic acid hydratase in catechol pathway